MVEKSEKFKETQKIMGLKQSSYVIGWVMTNFVKGIISCIIYLGIGVAVGGFETAKCSFGWICLAYFLYFTSSYAETYMFSTFFSDVSIGTDVTFLVQILSCFLYALSYISAIGTNNTILMMISILPQFALQTSMMGEGWMIFPLPGKMPREIDLSIQDASLMMGIMTVVFFVLYLYFDQTLPNEYGTQKKHFWFCRKRVNNNKNLKQISQIEQDIINQPMLNVNTEIETDDLDQSSAKYHEKIPSQKNLQPTVVVKNLLKQFGKLKAVNDLSVSLYENQIFCLLGHNGSGKTTTISLLTGLIEKSKGKIEIYNQDIDYDLDEIRGTIGLCNQKDVIYPELTVEEHLIFIGQVKGRTLTEILQDIETIIPKCSLTKDRKKFAGQLSGGNKRKLCLAMALIGNSKMIFLDEPSSGMDPVSRREIWQILEDMKNDNRTVLLTTHFLEEAEYLASRIGIMQKGQLLTVGRSDFIKKQFGVGYYLQIQPKIQQNNNNNNNNENEEQSQEQQQQQSINYTEKPELSEEKIKEITDLVFKSVPQVKINPQTSKGTVVFTLPFDQKQHFVNLFQQLEKDQSISINMEINSLEDTFVNIGMEEEEEEIENNQVRYADFSDIEIPECVQNKSPQYTCYAQFYSLFLRKYKLTFRSISILFSFIMPVLLQLIGVILAKYVATGQNFKNVTFWQMGFMANYSVIAYCCLANSQGGSLAIERELKIKYALSVMGMRTLPYYLATFAFDYSVYAINIAAYIGFCYAFGLTVITKKIGSVILIFFFLGLSITWCNYLIQYMFKSGRSAQKLQFWFNFVFLYATPAFFTLINSKTVQQVVACLTPYTTLYNAFIQSVSKDEIPSYLENYTQTLFKEVWAYYIIASCQALVFMLATLFLNNENLNRKKCSKKQQQDVEQQRYTQDKDASVLQEENRILNIGCDDTIQLKNVQKIYDNGFMAIKDSTFAVNKGEIFGLLGPNGSGKSTTFNILTSLIPKTSGSVQLNGKEVNQGEMDIYQNVGITPQFDPIWEILTVKEHLTIYGGLKGLTGKDLEDSIKYFIEVMQLQMYENVQAGVLSGGNKRKLCVTMALIGGPSMQFFDEPSTGLDPIARRFLWNTLKHSLQLRNSAIILTTHSMLEAESLCDKLGILINGQFKCIGSPSQLKKEYGEGYNIQIILDQHFNIKDKNQIIKDVLDKFPNSKLMSSLEESDGNLMFTLKYEGFSFYQVYKFLLQEKYSHIIKDFGISQSSLEQVFIYFSHFQKNENQSKPNSSNKLQ